MTPLLCKRLDYDSAVQTRRLENFHHILQGSALKDREFRKKVLAFSQRWGVEPEVVWRKVQTDWLFALRFAKDPLKQSIHQALAADFIRTELAPIAANFQQLAAAGRDSICLTPGGAILSSDDLAKAGGEKTDKTVDFSWEFPARTHDGKCLKFYASHKHTADEGGSQDNQHSDLWGYLTAACQCQSPDIFHIAIADGPFYQRNDRQMGISRLAAMNDGRSARSRWGACTVNQLAWVILKQGAIWLKTHRVPVSVELDALIREAEAAPEPEA